MKHEQRLWRVRKNGELGRVDLDGEGGDCWRIEPMEPHEARRPHLVALVLASTKLTARNMLGRCPIRIYGQNVVNGTAWSFITIFTIYRALLVEWNIAQHCMRLLEYSHSFRTGCMHSRSPSYVGITSHTLLHTTFLHFTLNHLLDQLVYALSHPLWSLAIEI